MWHHESLYKTYKTSSYRMINLKCLNVSTLVKRILFLQDNEFVWILAFSCAWASAGWEDPDSMSLSITSSWEESGSGLGDWLVEVRSWRLNAASEGRMFSNEYTGWDGSEECVLMSSGLWGGACRGSKLLDIRVGSMSTCGGGAGGSFGGMFPNLMTDGKPACCCCWGNCSWLWAVAVTPFLSAILTAGFSILMDLKSCRPFCSELRVKEVYRPEWM